MNVRWLALSSKILARLLVDPCVLLHLQFATILSGLLLMSMSQPSTHEVVVSLTQC